MVYFRQYSILIAVFLSGYDLSTEEGFQELLDDFEKIIGWQFLRGLHINDSKGEQVLIEIL